MHADGIEPAHMPLAAGQSTAGGFRFLRCRPTPGLSVLPAALPHGVPSEGERMSERVFKIVRHEEVESFARLGWTALDALQGTHHGTWSTLMEWTGLGEPVQPSLPPII